MNRKPLLIVTILLICALLGGAIIYLFVSSTILSRQTITRVVPVDATVPRQANDRLQMVKLGSALAGDKDFSIHVAAPDGTPASAEIWIVRDQQRFPLRRDDHLDRAELLKTDAGGNVKFKFPAAPVNIFVTGPAIAPQFLKRAKLDSAKTFEVKVTAGQTIQGVVNDSTGKPLAGVKITGKRQNFELDYLDATLLHATTDAAGHFAIAQVPAASTYELTGDLSGAPEGTFVETTSVSINASDPPPLTMLAMAGSVIKGRVVSEDNLPIADREIVAYTGIPKRAQWRATTGADGTFSLTGFPPQSSGGFACFGKRSDEIIRITDPQERAVFKSRSNSIIFHNLPVGTYDGLKIRVEKPVLVRGIVRDDQGKPVAKVPVEVLETNRIFTTNAKGEYEAQAPAQEPIQLKALEGQTTEESEVSPRLTLERGKSAAQDFLVRQRIVEPYDGVVKGQVVDESGNPVAKARVELGNEAVLPRDILYSGFLSEPLKKPTWKGGTFWPAHLLADDQGRFTFDMLEKGVSDLWAEDDTNRAGWVNDVTIGAADVKIILHARSENLRIEGRVVDENGNGVKGKATLCSTDNNTPEKLTEADVSPDGNFVLQTPVHHTDFQFLRLIFASDTGRIAWRTVPKCSGHLQLALKPEARISGTVTDTRGAPLAGVQIRPYSASDRQYGELQFHDALRDCLPPAKSDAAGHFVLPGIPVGATISIGADRDGFETEVVWNLKVLSPQRDAGKLEMKDAVTLAGTVHYEDGKPAAGVEISLGWHPAHTAVTDAGGQYHFDSLNHTLFSDQYTGVSAKLGELPDFEASLRYTAHPDSGDHLTGADIVVKRSMRWKLNQWKQQTGNASASRYLAAVVDDSDKSFTGKTRFDDAITLLNAQGEPRWKTAGLNVNVWFQNRGMLQLPDHSIWLLSEGLTKLNADGSVAWVKKDFKGTSLALDPKTQNVWLTTSVGTIYGEKILVFNSAGEKLKEWKIGAAEIAFSAHDDCFWAVGKTLRKISHDGKILFETPTNFAWLASSLEVNETDGSVWVVEQEHSQVAGSRECVHIFEPDGRLRKTLMFRAMNIAIDAKRGCAWVSGTPDGLMQLTLSGETIKTVPVLSGSIALEPDTGCVWAAGRDGVWRIDPAGNYLWGKPEFKEPKDAVGRWVAVVEPG